MKTLVAIAHKATGEHTLSAVRGFVSVIKPCESNNLPSKGGCGTRSRAGMTSEKLQGQGRYDRPFPCGEKKSHAPSQERVADLSSTWLVRSPKWFVVTGPARERTAVELGGARNFARCEAGQWHKPGCQCVPRSQKNLTPRLVLKGGN